jgi:hypothetical protein
MTGAELAVPRTAPRLRLGVLSTLVPVAWVEILLIVGVNLLVRRADPDFWWHLAVGEDILRDGIPRTDAYSWTAAGESWIAHEWLSEVIIALVQRTAGYGGNAILFTACIVGAMAIMYALGVRLGAGSRALILAIILATSMLILSMAIRPMIFSWLLFSVFLYILAISERQDRRELWLLPPLCLVWANMHLAFSMGLLLIAIWVAVRIWRRVRGEPVMLGGPLVLLPACVLLTLVNPSGIDVLLYPLHNLDHVASLRMLVIEWQSPVDQFFFFLIPFYVSAPVLLLALLVPRRPQLFLVLVGCATLLMSLTAARHISFFALALIPIVAVAFSAPVAPGVQRRAPTRVPAWLALGVLAVALVTAVQFNGGLRTLGSPPQEQYPRGGAEWIAQNNPDARMLNHYVWGGYLIYQYPATPVFIDGRTDVYWDSVFDDYLAIVRLAPEAPSLVNQYGVDTILIPKGSGLARSLRESPRWQEVYTGQIESVFVRRP